MSLMIPFLTQLIRQFFQEYTILIESTDLLVIVEEFELGIVIGVI